MKPRPQPAATQQGRERRDSVAGQGLPCDHFPVQPRRPPVSSAPLAAPASPFPPPRSGPGRLPGRSGRWLPMLRSASCGSRSSAMSVYPQRRPGRGGAREGPRCAAAARTRATAPPGGPGAHSGAHALLPSPRLFQPPVWRPQAGKLRPRCLAPPSSGRGANGNSFMQP